MPRSTPPPAESPAAAQTHIAKTRKALRRPLRLAIIGPPGSGKGSQCVFIKERYPELCYINPPMLLREEIARQTPRGMDAQQCMLSGEPIPPQTYVDILRQRAQASACRQGFIVDGMPTNADQAEVMTKSGLPLDALLTLQTDDSTVMKRTSGRMVHQRSGRIYHESFARPKTAGKDDETGEALTQRHDDTATVAAARLERYKTNLKELLAYYDAEPYTPTSPTTTSSSDSSSLPPPPNAPRHWQAWKPVIEPVDANAGLDVVRQRTFRAFDTVIEEIARRHSKPWWKVW